MTDLGEVRDDIGPFLGWPAERGEPDEMVGVDPAAAGSDERRSSAREPVASESLPVAPIAAASQALPENLAPLVALLAARAVEPDTVREMLAIQREFELGRAREAYARALARFRAVAPTLAKDREVRADTDEKRGASASYRHTSLGHALERVNPLLGELGLNLSWHPRVEDGTVHVETRLTHELGHAESVTLPGAPDSSEGKNPLQAMKSTITYLERTGALALLGLAARDDDDDAASACPPPPPEGGFVSETQAEALAALLDAIEHHDGGARRRWFTHYAGIFDPADNAIGLAIPASMYERAERQLANRLEERRRTADAASGGLSV